MTDEKRCRSRTLLILKDIVESPFQFTKADWCKRFAKKTGAIKEDLTELRNAGFEIETDRLHRHGIIPNKVSENLKKCLYFTQYEFSILQQQINKSDLTFNQKELITNKLENIFDLTKVGGAVFNNVFIQKLDVLLSAVHDKQKVILYNYRSSNKSTISDRTVEAFRIFPKDDMIYAYEAASNQVKHFKISRFEGIKQLDDDWENQGKHYPTTPDVFGYVSEKTTSLYIKLNISGYNLLIERFPKTSAFCQKCPTDIETIELECEVNDSFYGITQFLLGQHQNIKAIIEPIELITHLNKTIKNMKF